MVNLKNVLTVGSNGVKCAIALAASIAVAEAGIYGARGAEADIKAGKALFNHATNPTPVKVKKGFFKKEEVVTINPITGVMKPYKGDKKPVNKKAMKLKKVK